MGTGNPPGCWASPELVAATAREAAGPDKGLAARLERAAITVAILKGIGYAGAYIGGTHDPNHIARIIERGEELAPRWKELLPDLQFGRAGGFYLYDPPQRAEAVAHVPADGARRRRHGAAGAVGRSSRRTRRRAACSRASSPGSIAIRR